MRIILYALAALVVTLIAGYFFLVARVRRMTRRRDAAVSSLLRPVADAIGRGETVAVDLLEARATDPLTRNRLYDVLDAASRADLFPRQQLTSEAFAYSDLCYWLAHPHELGAVPDEVELLRRVQRSLPDLGTVDFFVFRFRVHPPHWAALKGWLAGIAGPYAVEGPLATMARSTFSRFEPADARTPEGHLEECLKATSS